MGNGGNMAHPNTYNNDTTFSVSINIDEDFDDCTGLAESYLPSYHPPHLSEEVDLQEYFERRISSRR